MFDEVEKFNHEVIGINRKPGTIEDQTEFNWCIGTIREELDEFIEAHDQQDFIAELDSVIDLLYFGVGFMTRMGIPAYVSKEIFYAVHTANMTKNRGMKEERDVTHDLDAVKPIDWESPEDKIYAILNKYFGTK